MNLFLNNSEDFSLSHHKEEEESNWEEDLCTACSPGHRMFIEGEIDRLYIFEEEKSFGIVWIVLV